MRNDPRADHRPIGYYVHHQGHGHLVRACAIRARLKRRCTLIGTSLDHSTSLPVLHLPDDRITEDFAGADGEVSRPEAFHYAPIGMANVRERMAMLASWVRTANPIRLVVDVSCEIALFARLLSVPVALIRLAGRRIDTPHLEAFRTAEVLIAPFPAIFEDDDTPSWVRGKTVYAGLIGGTPLPSLTTKRSRRISVVLGRGSDPVPMGSLVAAARATPAWDWQVFGPMEACDGLAKNLAINGWCEQIATHVAESEIVVGGCGDGLLAEIAAQGTRFVCIPEDRAYNEQRSKARTLAQHEMAVVRQCWPAPGCWSEVLKEAQSLDPGRLARLYDPAAADTAASAIETGVVVEG